ncbi:MAG TPA: YdbL family protein [Dongiaceae bacterium]|nr:YdbL family protein [Dongiaceae bacterium]
MMHRVAFSPARLVAALAIIAGLALAVPAAAGPLDDAKAAGYVGEQPDGYLGLVRPDAPADVAAMVADVNAKRRAHYADIAAGTGSSVDQVGAVVAQKVYQEAAPGHYLLVNGQWVQR